MFGVHGNAVDTINNESLMKFLRDFNSIEFKYNVQKNHTNTSLDDGIYEELYRFERSEQNAQLLKTAYDNVYQNLQLVYGHNDTINNDMSLFVLARQKIVNEYLNIPGLERLFSELFFDFEWDMHTGRNFEHHRPDYYRDHFIHQIRDMFIMINFLQSDNMYDIVKTIIATGESKVSVFTRNGIDHALNKDLRASALQQKCAKSCGYSGAEYINKYNRERITKYIVYSSSMLAALFHDIGYPLCHYQSVRQRVSHYMPTMYMFINNDSDSFDRIASILGSSLLFTVVSRKEIEDRLKKSDHRDHGAYSAIAFLMQFYDAGIIHSIDIEKKIAIELAALAIYNHTSKYSYSESDAKTSYYRMIFKLNPISYLLRICDDMQEWERVYFEISDAGDMLYCPKCETPYIRYCFGGNKSNSLTPYEYICACNHKKGCSAQKIASFPQRKLFLVNANQNMRMQFINDDNKRHLIISLKYDLLSLLQMSRINHTYAKFRLKELNLLKLNMEHQDYSCHPLNCTDHKKTDLLFCDKVFLDYFMTANPIAIKAKIFYDFCKQNDIAFSSFLKDSNSAKNAISRVYRKSFESYYGSQNYKKKRASLPQSTKDIFNKSILFYAYLCLLIEKAYMFKEEFDLFNQYSSFIDKIKLDLHSVIDSSADKMNSLLTKIKSESITFTRKFSSMISEHEFLDFHTYMTAFAPDNATLQDIVHIKDLVNALPVLDTIEKKLEWFIKSNKDIYDKLLQEAGLVCNRTTRYSIIMHTLIEDTILQSFKIFNNQQCSLIYDTDYLELYRHQFESSEIVYSRIEEYVCAENSFNSYSSSSYIGFYQDIRLFEILNHSLS